MEYLYRALNQVDMEVNPLKNGLINKQTIDQIAKNIYHFCFFHTEGISTIFGGYENVTKEVYNSIYQDIKTSFVKGLLPLIMHQVEERQRYIENVIQGLYQEETFLESYTSFLEIVSTLQTHLCHGSKMDTSWISFSKSLPSIQKYYLSQKKHEVAVVESEINAVFDFASPTPLIAYDLSSREKIEQNPFLINKLETISSSFPKAYTVTSKRARGFNYATAVSEVLYYAQVPKEKIVALLKPLEIDLLLNEALDFRLYKQRREYARLFYQKLLYDLKKSLQSTLEYDAKTEYVLEKHFKEQKSIRSISASVKEEEELFHVKKKILARAFTLNSPIVQRISPSEIRIMETVS